MARLIRVRGDDVLVHSEAMKGAEFSKWKKHHQWVVEGPPYFFHVAAILCKEIQDFPEAIEYIRKEVAEGRLALDLHGWEHIDYGKLETEDIELHLEQSFDFFLKTFNCLPFRWATPWGANSPNIRKAARKFSLIVEGVTDPVIDQSQAVNIVQHADSIEPLIDKIILFHWYEKGLKLWRIIQAAKYGSWKQAALAHPEEYK